MSKQQRVLTGITTTGTPHLGNYVGAIKPAIAASRDDGTDSFYFLADYHALVKCEDPSPRQAVHARDCRDLAGAGPRYLAFGVLPTVRYHRDS